jgi:hypothetical protein
LHKKRWKKKRFRKYVSEVSQNFILHKSKAMLPKLMGFAGAGREALAKLQVADDGIGLFGLFRFLLMLILATLINFRVAIWLCD